MRHVVCEKTQYIRSKRQKKESVNPLMNTQHTVVMDDAEKTEVCCAF